MLFRMGADRKRILGDLLTSRPFSRVCLPNSLGVSPDEPFQVFLPSPGCTCLTRNRGLSPQPATLCVRFQ